MSRIISLHPTHIYASISNNNERINNLEKIVKKIQFCIPTTM